ncbi:hypothetical protein FGO68_gene1539 [Halteria grandinella]|uniref:non-specific serine/threonine protein kinase n=1 Tax=Halteria grandinella TaxID=5974 RepID=A0A8J8NUP3_HALGN|nr:hypothetical protein FGO68_gene1539 [Halteria grandinella]
MASKTYGEYTTIFELGKGSYGTVYLAEHTVTRKRVALKVQIETKDYLTHHCNQVFENEIEFFKKVKHPYIVEYIEDFRCEVEGYSPHCIVFELADELDLDKRMKASEQGIPEELALTWFTQTALALEQIHSQGLMHRDVKPANILLFGEKIGGIAQLADFGSIKVDKSSVDHTIRVGTFRYFAPERLLGEMDDYNGKADVWSLGISLHEMLTGGGHPFSKPDDQKYLDGIKKNKLLIKESISKPLQDLIQFLLEKDPIKRPSMKDVLKHPLVSIKIKLITEQLTTGE